MKLTALAVRDVSLPGKFHRDYHLTSSTCVVVSHLIRIRLS